MVRAFILGTIFSLSVALAYWASNKISYNVDIGSLGFGLGIAALTGFAWAMLNGWWTTVTRPFRPMTVTIETRETPAQVNLAAMWAIAQSIIVIGIVIAAAIWIVANS